MTGGTRTHTIGVFLGFHQISFLEDCAPSVYIAVAIYQKLVGDL